MKLKFWSISERIYYRWKQRSLLGSIFPSFIVSDSLIRKKCSRANPLVPSSGSTLTTCTRTGSAPFPQEEQPPGSSFRWWSTGTKLGNNLWPRLDQLQQRFAAKTVANESNVRKQFQDLHWLSKLQLPIKLFFEQQCNMPMKNIVHCFREQPSQLDLKYLF